MKSVSTLFAILLVILDTPLVDLGADTVPPLLRVCEYALSQFDEITWSVSNSIDIYFSAGPKHPNSDDLLGKNFQMTWTAMETCNGNVASYDGTSGEIKSPTFQEYNHPCEYDVAVAEGKFIQFTLEDINIGEGDGSECTTDSLKVYDGEDYVNLRRQFCGTKNEVGTPKVFTTKTHFAKIIFTLDNSVKVASGKYFVMSYKQVIDPNIVYALAGAAGALVLIIIIALLIVFRRKLVCCLARRIGDTGASGLRPIRKPHIMISYRWDVKPEVLKFRERLREVGYRVWIDMEQMHKSHSTVDAMTYAVDDSAIVVPVLTAKYEKSKNCRKEIEYAERVNKRIVPIRLQKKYTPGGWLAFVLGQTLFHDLANEGTYERQLENFLLAIAGVAETALKEPGEVSDVEEENEEEKKEEEAAQPKDELKESLMEVNKSLDNDGGT